MASRSDHLVDMQTRLNMVIGIAAHANPIKVYRSRSTRVPEDVLAAVLLYSPSEEGTPLSTHGTPQYSTGMTFAIEIRIQKLDDWDIEAGTITELVKSALFSDADWMNRWQGNPSFSVRQFLESKAEQQVCGEVLTLNVTDRTPQIYTPAAEVIGGVDVAINVIDPNSPDADPEASLTINTPEE